MVAAARREAEQAREAAHREVDEMARQREEISAQFAQIRSVLELGMGENEGALMGRLDPSREVASGS
jgi:hypothetical protein